MTKRERHEIAVSVRTILNDKDGHELLDLYKKLMGTDKGYRSYVRSRCVNFWSDGFDPYLDKEYLDYEWFKVDGRIINYDDLWCFIRDELREDIEEKAKKEKKDK